MAHEGAVEEDLDHEHHDQPPGPDGDSRPLNDNDDATEEQTAEEPAA